MRKTMARLAILALAAPALSGCALGHLLGFRSHRGPVESAQAQAWPEQQLVIGKKSLDQGQYAAAIQAFSNAQLFREQAANAWNGMAIAWVQLGRPDLAERYFKQAIAGDPGDQRFQANLSRFYATVAEADVRKTLVEAPVLALEELQNLPMPALVPPGPVRAEATATRMTRISAHEVAISGPPVAAPAAYRPHAARTAWAAHRNARGFAAHQPVRIVMAASPPAAALPGPGPSR